VGGGHVVGVPGSGSRRVEVVGKCKGNLTILRRVLHLSSQGKSKENTLRIPG
jgi:hypothetical protein